MLKTHIMLDITGEGNLRCRHCLSGDKYRRRSHGPELTRSLRREVVDPLAAQVSP